MNACNPFRLSHDRVMRLASLGESGLIRKFCHLITASPKVILGIGDDTAVVVPTGKKRLMLLTCDPVIEGIHFDATARPCEIGWKAMARNLSDIAAMGGAPLYALVAAALPETTSVCRAMDIYRGLAAAARRYGVDIVGGDTSRSPSGIHLAVTVVGEAPTEGIITRSGARAGDVLCVTGTLGASIFGKHLRFQPRLKEAQFLARHFRPSAMMDLSDGLASDLQRLSEQSGVGFEVWADALPISRALNAQRLSQHETIRHALCDGEDYELVFTVSARRFRMLGQAWKKKFRLPLASIGVVLPRKSGLRLLGHRGGPTLPFPRQDANDHFRNRLFMQTSTSRLHNRKPATQTAGKR